MDRLVFVALDYSFGPGSAVGPSWYLPTDEGDGIDMLPVSGAGQFNVFSD